MLRFYLNKCLMLESCNDNELCLTFHDIYCILNTWKLIVMLIKSMIQVDQKYDAWPLHDFWWLMMMLDDTWWHLMMPDDAWWCLITIDDAWWCLMMIDDTWWHMMMHYDASWCMMTLKDTWWCLIYDTLK